MCMGSPDKVTGNNGDRAGKATTQQRIQWGELTRVQMAHRRDEADESRGTIQYSWSMSTVEQADQLP